MNGDGFSTTGDNAVIKIKRLLVKFGGLELSLGEATIPPYILLGGLIVVVIVVISRAV
jgi:hypothetical protein